MKKQEAKRRMAAVAQAARNPRSAACLQQRASLVGGASKWKITNLEQSFAAIAKWVKALP